MHPAQNRAPNPIRYTPNYGESTMLDSLNSIFFELIGTWNGDLGGSDHLWTVFFGAELSGGVPGAGDGMKKSNLLAMLRYG